MTWFTRAIEGAQRTFKKIKVWWNNDVPPEIRDFVEETVSEFGQRVLIEAAEAALQVFSKKKTFSGAADELWNDVKHHAIGIGDDAGKRITANILRVQLTALERKNEFTMLAMRSDTGASQLA